MIQSFIAFKNRSSGRSKKTGLILLIGFVFSACILIAPSYAAPDAQCVMPKEGAPDKDLNAYNRCVSGYVPIESPPPDPREVEFNSRDYNECIVEGVRCPGDVREERLPSKLVKRDGGRLTFQCVGKSITLSDNLKGEGTKVHVYSGYFPDVRFHLVSQGHWEGGSYLLISQSSCEQFEMYGAPFLSPDKSRFVAISASEAYDPSEIVVWRVTPTRLIEEFSFQTRGWALYRFLGWASPKKVRLAAERDLYEGEAGCQHNGRIRAFETLENAESGWKLRIEQTLSLKCGP